jgi:gamma-glutamyl hercynylcysteine S-oxide synthase
MDTKLDETRDVLVEKLAEARQRTRWLLETVSDEDLAAQHDEIMSPLIWDYGHIGNYEELWLLNRAFGKRLSGRELYDFYDASLTPRSERPSLNLLETGLPPTATSTLCARRLSRRSRTRASTATTRSSKAASSTT